MHLILAIDDEKTTLRLLDEQLKNLGYQVITAQSAQEGIGLARTGNPDLILLDVMMPRMTGFEALRVLKKDEQLKPIPVIILTAKSKHDDVVTAMGLGAIDYMVKPHEIHALNQKIESALQIGKIHKLKELAERTEYIQVARGGKTTMITFLKGIRDRAVLQEARKIFTPFFVKLVKSDDIVFDLRRLDDMSEEDVKAISVILTIFAGSEVHLVAGRHYGSLVGGADFGDTIRLHISMGDLDIYLAQKQKM
ncbi:MAG: response regulator [Spirochaetes bacterium]|nr:MAG: response regulator [Spirochaetota bacterium]